MTLLMGKTIKKLRKEQDLTQEQVAAALGVTTAAVSKWETDSTYPDISLLSPLARMLRTNVDRLVSFEEKLSDIEVANFEKKARVIFETGDSRKAMDYCNELLKEYPTDDLLRFRLASTSFFYIGASGDEEEAAQQLAETIRLFETLRSSENLELRHASLHVLVSLYTMSDDLDKAEEAIEELPTADYDTRMMKTNILYMKKEYEESRKLTQICLFQQLRDIGLHLYNLAKIACKYEQYEKAMTIADVGIKLDKLLHVDQITGTNANYYLFKAEILARVGEKQSALMELENFIPALQAAFAIKETSGDLLFDTIQLKDSSVSTQYIAERMADLIEQSDEFQPLLAEKRFIALLEKLRSLE